MPPKKILLYYNDLIFQPSSIFLDKDFGQVPLVISKLYKYKLAYLIVTKNVNKDFLEYNNCKVIQIAKVLNSLPSKIDFVKNIFAYKYLFKEKKSFDRLIFFPFSPVSDFFFLTFFKLFNPDAKILLKLDANIDLVNKFDISFRKTTSIFRYFKSYFYYRKLLEKSDLICYETFEVGEKLKNSFLGSDNISRKIVNLFNGVSESLINQFHLKINDFSEKENLVLIVGRHGSPDKNSELVFKATSNLTSDWKFVFLGPIEEDFLNVIEEYKKIIPNFSEKYIFEGLITNKGQYFNYFNRAKILLVTSNKEGFPNVYSEALYFNNYIVTSNVSGSLEATNNGRIGQIFNKNNDIELNKILSHLISNPSTLISNIPLAKRYSHEFFVWEKTLDSEVFGVFFNSNK